MRFISTQIHGWIDYTMGVILIISPWVLRFGVGGAETWVIVILGFGSIIYAALTDYELGLLGVIPMRVHLWIDIAAGVVLAVSPWLFGFADHVWLPHLILGLLAIGAGACTHTETKPGGAGRKSLDVS